ncbi:MAG: sulfatase [Planctomycetota bacterium]
MRCVMVMFDSLNRHFLSPYGATWTRTPNFQRLAQRAVTFDRSYVCSMPCMPARRDLHTGRPGFLHRGWGPLEPFDVSVFEHLRNKTGVYSHLCTDHYHYFEEGGANYHGRYDTWEFFRGQEGDPWFGKVGGVEEPDHQNQKGRHQDWVNRTAMPTDADHYQTKTFTAGVEFIDRNAAADNWLLQIEAFDPHEPFFAHRQWKDLFPDPVADAPLYDWPKYGKAPSDPALVDRARRNYAALLAKCDASLGNVLDAFDRHDLWKDTMLVVWTDHGFLLGEHGMMAKNEMPLYEELSHTPLFVWDPRAGASGERRGSLVQPAIDLCPTLCNFFGVDIPETVKGRDLGETIATDKSVRDAALFGYDGSRVNLVTERHAYYRAPRTKPYDVYTLMPSHMRSRYGSGELRPAQLAPPLAYSDGVPVLKLPAERYNAQVNEGDLLFDLADDPTQSRPMNDAELEAELCDQMVTLMHACDAPPKQFERMELEADRRGTR